MSLNVYSDTYIVGNKSVMHQMPSGSLNLYLTHLNEKDENSLLFQKYKSRIEDYFFAYGYRIVQDINDANLIAFVSYGVGPAIINTVSIPVYGSRTASVFEDVTPFDGQINPVYLSVTTYGQVGTDIQQYRTFPRNFALDIYALNNDRSQKPNKIYEGRILSEGACGDIDYVLNEMIMSMFDDFPGPSSNKTNFQLPVIHTCLK